jgi:hypothetical protein
MLSRKTKRDGCGPAELAKVCFKQATGGNDSLLHHSRMISLLLHSLFAAAFNFEPFSADTKTIRT